MYICEVERIAWLSFGCVQFYTIYEIIPLTMGYTLSYQCNGGRVGKKQCQGPSITLPPLYRQKRVYPYTNFSQISKRLAA